MDASRLEVGIHRQSLVLCPSLPLQTWELAYILYVINSEKKCVPGAKGLVFAAGMEPLVSRFAQQGCTIHATDFPTDAADKDNPWVQTKQHASLGLRKVRSAASWQLQCRSAMPASAKYAR
jgi:hypothetical protein